MTQEKIESHMIEEMDQYSKIVELRIDCLSFILKSLGGPFTFFSIIITLLYIKYYFYFIVKEAIELVNNYFKKIFPPIIRKDYSETPIIGKIGRV